MKQKLSHDFVLYFTHKENSVAHSTFLSSFFCHTEKSGCAHFFADINALPGVSSVALSDTDSI